MKIKILQSNETVWYKDYIGQIFELLETQNNHQYYIIKRPPTEPWSALNYMNWVFKKDAILLNREFKLQRILADHISPTTPENNESNETSESNENI